MSCARPIDGNVAKVKLGYGPLLLSGVPPSRSGVMRDAASSSDGSGAVSRAGVDAAAPPPHAASGMWSAATPPPPPGVGHSESEVSASYSVSDCAMYWS